MKPIPLKERLVVRLAVGMIGVALLSLFFAFIIQFISLALSNIRAPNIEARLEQLIAEHPNDQELFSLLETPKRIRTIFFRGGIFSLFVSGMLWIYFAIRFASNIAHPIEQATLASAQITNGDLTSRVEIPKGVKGESLKLLEHFNEMANSLEIYERERTEMIASIAHELRTPLAVMSTRLEIMDEGLIELNSGEVKRLRRQVSLLSRLVSDLRTLSLADANKLTLNRQLIKLDELIKTVTESFRLSAKETGLELILELEAVGIFADEDRLTQVIFNLLDNALKHSYQEGKIGVKLIDRADSVKIVVQDTGKGFTDSPDQLFKRFYTTKIDSSSSGLGLALVKTIVELHGGTVVAESTKNQGAKFSVILPKALF